VVAAGAIGAIGVVAGAIVDWANAGAATLIAKTAAITADLSDVIG
jgi:hypothetical protein